MADTDKTPTTDGVTEKDANAPQTLRLDDAPAEGDQESNFAQARETAQRNHDAEQAELKRTSK